MVYALDSMIVNVPFYIRLHERVHVRTEGPFFLGRIDSQISYQWFLRFVRFARAGFAITKLHQCRECL